MHNVLDMASGELSTLIEVIDIEFSLEYLVAGGLLPASLE